MNSDVIEAIPIPAFVISANDTLSSANTAFRALFPHLQIGRSYLTVFRQPNLVTLIEKLRSNEQTDAVEITVKRQTDDSFRVTGAVLAESDVLLCLQDMNETAAAIQLRQNFVADLGHELRTPLTAISGILETCEDDQEALAHFLPTMSREVERMKRLVADLLTLSRVESNLKRTPNQNVVLQALVGAASTPLAVLAKEKGIRIELAMPDDPIHFQGDADEITRAVLNLVENGLRYGNEGGVVKVTGRIDRSPKSPPNVLIEVRDDGPGVEIHHIPRLTERFYRVDNHRSRDSGGSGLGLAIVKHIVNHHRGRMTFDSEPDKGSRVTLVLPLEQSGS